MQRTITCPNCDHIIPWTVPELTEDVWHTNCPACDSVTELKAAFGKVEEAPSFVATGELLLEYPSSLEPKT